MTVQINLDVTPPQLHAAQFSALVVHYLREREKHLDPITIKGYRLRLDYFLDWWQTEGPPRQWMLDEGTLGEYSKYLQGIAGRLSWHSRNDALRRLRQVLRWAHQRNYVAVDFAEFVPSVKGNPAPRNPLGLHALLALLVACESTQEPQRNRAIVAVLAGTGVRCEECAALKVEEVTFYPDESGLIRLSVAKNDSLRHVAFDPITGQFLAEWLARLPYARGPLFPSRNGRKSGTPSSITPAGLHDIIRTIAEAGKVGDQINGPHDLRRMFATTWARRLPEHLHLLQRQMGHANLGTTLIYISNDPTIIRETLAAQPVSPMAVLAHKPPATRQITASSRALSAEP